MPYLPVDTAIVVELGPLVDDTDWQTLETAIAYNEAGMSVDLFKNSGTLITKVDITPTTAGANDWVHKGNAVYSLEITAAQNNTEGTLRVVGIADGVLVFESAEYTVVPVAVYNSLILGSDRLQVHAIEISNDLITAAALAADAVAEIADGVWDEATSGHGTAGTFGKAVIDILNDTNELQTDDVPGLIAALNDPTAAAIADAVWDEALSGHVAAGSFGKAVADIETDATAILADTNELQTDDVPGLIAALNDPTAAAIADAVWDEALSGHTSAGTYGKAVADIEADTNELQTDDLPGLIEAGGTPATIADAIWDEALSGHVAAGSYGKALADIETDATAILADTNELQTDDVPGLIAALNDPTAAAITDAVWDEALAGHLASGSTGEALEAADATADVAAIADAVWDEALSGHVAAGSFGKAVADIETDATAILVDTTAGGVGPWTTGAAGPTSAAIADAVLDEALSGHVAAGSYGKAVADIETDATAILADTNELQTDDVPGLIAALNDPTAAAIANAVWDEALSGHVAAASFGKAVADIETDATAILVDTAAGGAGPWTTAAAGPTAAAIADAVWDEANADHLGSGSTGAALDSASSAGGPSAAAIADAVWDEALAGHVAAGSAGKALGDLDTSSVKLASDGWDAVIIEPGINARQALSIIGAATGGELSGAETSTVVIMGLGTLTTRITAVVDGAGNRDIVTLTPPA